MLVIGGSNMYIKSLGGKVDVDDVLNVIKETLTKHGVNVTDGLARSIFQGIMKEYAENADPDDPVNEVSMDPLGNISVTTKYKKGLYSDGTGGVVVEGSLEPNTRKRLNEVIDAGRFVLENYDKPPSFFQEKGGLVLSSYFEHVSDTIMFALDKIIRRKDLGMDPDRVNLDIDIDLDGMRLEDFAKIVAKSYIASDSPRQMGFDLAGEEDLAKDIIEYANSRGVDTLTLDDIIDIVGGEDPSAFSEPTPTHNYVYKINGNNDNIRVNYVLPNDASAYDYNSSIDPYDPAYQVSHPQGYASLIQLFSHGKEQDMTDNINDALKEVRDEDYEDEDEDEDFDNKNEQLNSMLSDYLTVVMSHDSSFSSIKDYVLQNIDNVIKKLRQAFLRDHDIEDVDPGTVSETVDEYLDELLDGTPSDERIKNKKDGNLVTKDGEKPKWWQVGARDTTARKKEQKKKKGTTSDSNMKNIVFPKHIINSCMNNW